MELDRTYHEEELGRTLRYVIGVEARGEEETRSTKNNIGENGWKTKGEQLGGSPGRLSEL